MPGELVPEKWRRAVAAILDDGYSSRIEVSGRALREFQSMFPAAFAYELYGAFSAALKRRVVYGKRIYGKVCLTGDGRVVVIFSAHAPPKGEKA